MSPFRDRLGSLAPLDGVAWALEVEIKFYLVVLLFCSMTGKAKFLQYLALGVAIVLVTNLYSSNVYKAGVVAALVFRIK